MPSIAPIEYVSLELPHEAVVFVATVTAYGWPNLSPKRRDMISVGGDPPLVTDHDVDALTRQFVNSDYVDDEYANWPLDRRLDGFLRNRSLSRVADNGDICNIILDRAMTYYVIRASRTPDAASTTPAITAAASRGPSAL